MTSKEKFLRENLNRFAGMVALSKPNEQGKSFPIDKKDKWMFSNDNPAIERLEFCIKNSIDLVGVLVKTDILVVDLDNKVGKFNGKEYWGEISDVPWTYKSQSGRGAHLWVKNPSGKTFRSDYSKQSGVQEHEAIELFNGDRQYLRLPTNEFDWSNLDLDNLPSLPEGLLSKIPESKDRVVAVIGKKVDKLELGAQPLEVIHYYLDGIQSSEYDEFFKLTALLHNISEYYRQYKKDTVVADGIKILWDRHFAKLPGYDKAHNFKIWQGVAFRDTAGLGSLIYLSSHPRRGLEGLPLRKRLRVDWAAFIADLKDYRRPPPQAPERALPFSVC